MKKNCKTYLEQMSSITTDPMEKKVLEVWIQKGQSHPCLEWAQMPDTVRFAIEDLLEEHPPVPQACHENAWKLCVASAQIRMHSGFVKAPFPIEHSWCSYIDTTGTEYFFDPTRLSVFEGKSSPFEDYFSVLSLKKEEALHWAYVTETTGPFHRLEAQYKIEKKWDSKETAGEALTVKLKERKESRSVKPKSAKAPKY